MQIENGADGVIVGGTTGEGQLMSWDEHIMLIGHTINCFGTSIKVQTSLIIVLFNNSSVAIKFCILLLFNMSLVSGDRKHGKQLNSRSNPRNRTRVCSGNARSPSHQPILWKNLTGRSHFPFQMRAPNGPHNHLQRPHPNRARHPPNHHPLSLLQPKPSWHQRMHGSQPNPNLHPNQHHNMEWER